MKKMKHSKKATGRGLSPSPGRKSPGRKSPGRQSPNSPDHERRGSKAKRPRVAMVAALSPSLAKYGANIAVFTRESALNFYGYQRIEVLGGVITVDSYVLRPGGGGVAVCVPQGVDNPAVSMVAMDPAMTDEEFVEYLKPFRESKYLHFHPRDPQNTPCATAGGGQGRGCVILDLGQEDIDSLNKLTISEWEGITGVAVLIPYQDNLISFLPRYGLDLKNAQQLLKGFYGVKSQEAVEVPTHFRHMAWDLVAHLGVSVLICGSSGTGKSTLGKYFINYMLNRFPAVGYLECDPGQCEFTCPEILSLHVLTEPVFGPPYTHQRTPLKAYYYGDKSPKADPEYYIRLLQFLYSHFVTSVRSEDPNMPLIINTCGWLSDMGVQLFLDILRSLSPTHVIRLMLSQRSNEDCLKVLPQLTEDFLTSTPGLFTPPDREVWSQGTPESGCYFNPCNMVGGPSLFGGVRMMGVQKVVIPSRAKRLRERKGQSPMTMGHGSEEAGQYQEEEEGEERGELRQSVGRVGLMGGAEEAPAGGVEEGSREKTESPCLSSDMEMYGSSEEEFSVSESSGEEMELSSLTEREERIRHKRKQKRKRLHLIKSKLTKEKRIALQSDRYVTIQPTYCWEEVLSYQVYHTCSPSAVRTKSSGQLRELALISYFSSLLPVAQEVGRKYNLPDPLGNLLRYAPPLVIPWADVAIHVAHKPVPKEHLLYAFNEKIICLGQVEPDILMGFSSGHTDTFKLLKVNTPLIEYIGLGLLRAIDPVKKEFYVTTPLGAEGLEKVNVLVLGNPDKPDFKPTASPQCRGSMTPYQTRYFRPIELGEYTWSATTRTT